MSVEIITGNLLEFTKWDVAGHCANCRHTFGSGLALQIKQLFPAAYEADGEAYRAALGIAPNEDIAAEGMLGEFSVADVGDGCKIVNIYAQKDYGRERRQLNYEALYSALNELRNALEKAHHEGRAHSLGLPYRLGSDRAGGTWSIVESMIRALFEESPIPVYIVKLPE